MSVLRLRTLLSVMFFVLVQLACASDRTAAPEQRRASAAESPAKDRPLPDAAVPTGPANAVADRRYDGPLPPLPYAAFVPPRPMPVVQTVYEFAARRPDVLRYVPCYCGCQRNGHGDNADCFVSGRDANGRPRWDLHGMG